MKPVESDRLDAEERRELSSSDFGIPEERAFPMPDAAHVRAAEAYFRYASVMIRSLSWRGIYWKKRLNTECV